MDAVRRPSLLAAEEPLLLNRSAIETAVRFTRFAEESGLPAQAVLSSTLCAMPLPIYTDFGTFPDGRPRVRWEGTRPEFMWHPLMWLPPRLAGRYQINDPETGEARLEDDDLWAVRVSFELTASGLYDPVTGTWFDILSAHGIDVEDELDLARITDWLDGYGDEVLDAIDLSDYLDIDPPSWALESALSLRDQLERASWALIADDLLDLADDSLRQSASLAHADQLTALRSLAGLGGSLLTHVPATAGEQPLAEFFAALYESVDLTTEQPEPFAVVDALEQARHRLHAVREAYWSDVEQMSRPDESPAGV